MEKDSSIESNSKPFSMWLLQLAEDGGIIPGRNVAKERFSDISKEIQNRLFEISNLDLHPENYQVISGRFS